MPTLGEVLQHFGDEEVAMQLLVGNPRPFLGLHQAMEIPLNIFQINHLLKSILASYLTANSLDIVDLSWCQPNNAELIAKTFMMHSTHPDKVLIGALQWQRAGSDGHVGILIVDGSKQLIYYKDALGIGQADYEFLNQVSSKIMQFFLMKHSVGLKGPVLRLRQQHFPSILSLTALSRKFNLQDHLYFSLTSNGCAYGAVMNACCYFDDVEGEVVAKALTQADIDSLKAKLASLNLDQLEVNLEKNRITKMAIRDALAELIPVTSIKPTLLLILQKDELNVERASESRKKRPLQAFLAEFQSFYKACPLAKWLNENFSTLMQLEGSALDSYLKTELNDFDFSKASFDESAYKPELTVEEKFMLRKHEIVREVCSEAAAHPTAPPGPDMGLLSGKRKSPRPGLGCCAVS